MNSQAARLGPAPIEGVETEYEPGVCVPGYATPRNRVAMRGPGFSRELPLMMDVVPGAFQIFFFVIGWFN